MNEIMWIAACLFLLVGAAKKKEGMPEWIQTTLDGSATKGALNWMNKNDSIGPDRFEICDVKGFRDDGWSMPDWCKDEKQICVLGFQRDAPNERPLLITQATAITSIQKWFQEADGVWTANGRIGIFTPDDQWSCTFVKRNPTKFAPFHMEAGIDQQ